MTKPVNNRELKALIQASGRVSDNEPLGISRGWWLAQISFTAVTASKACIGSAFDLCVEPLKRIGIAQLPPARLGKCRTRQHFILAAVHEHRDLGILLAISDTRPLLDERSVKPSQHGHPHALNEVQSKAWFTQTV